MIIRVNFGPAWFGQALLENNEIGQVQGVRTVPDPGVEEIDLFFNLRLTFSEIAEPDSCLHPTEKGRDLWAGLSQQTTWLWNGSDAALSLPPAIWKWVE